MAIWSLSPTRPLSTQKPSCASLEDPRLTLMRPCLGPALAIGILSTSLALKPSGLRSRCAAVIGISFLTGGFFVLNGALFLVLLFFTEKEMLFQTLACFFRFGVQLFYGWLFGTNSSGDRSSSQAHGPPGTSSFFFRTFFLSPTTHT